MALRLSLLLLFISPLSTVRAGAQDSATVIAQNAWFYNEPGGARIAQMERGTRMAARRSRGDWQEVVLVGWIFRPSVGPAPAQGFDLQVTQRPNENLRLRPNQTVLARLEQGFLLHEIGISRNWVNVQRVGWMRRSVLDVPPQGAPPPASGATAASESAIEVSSVIRESALRRSPNGDTTMAVPADVSVRVLERSGEWVRIKLEGWLLASDIEERDLLTGVTPDDLRSDPELFLGKSVRWRVQFIGRRIADELRPDLPLGQTYLLVRGPLPAGEYIYVVVPEDRVDEVRGIHPLSVLTIHGRIRTPQTRYLGSSVLDLIAFDVETAP